MKKAGQFFSPAADDHEPSLVLGTHKSDDIVTGGGPQHIISGNGSDAISSGGGPDVVDAGNGNDTVHAGGGPDTVDVGNGKDTAFGGAGPDVLAGGNGKDVLIGGPAADTLTGGRGADNFVYAFQGDAPAHGEEGGSHEEGGGGGCAGGGGGGGCGGDEGDAIRPARRDDHRFPTWLDHIDFSQLPSGVSVFGRSRRRIPVWISRTRDNAVVRVDTNGDVSGEHAAEMAIVLIGVDANSVSAEDFLLSGVSANMTARPWDAPCSSTRTR